MNDNRQSALVTQPVRVEAQAIEGELANLWTRATEGTLPGVSAPVARVLVSNLLVYARSSDDADEASATIAEIAADHPSRVVIADAQAGEPGHEMEANVSMFCSITERGRRLCGEEIRLHADGLASSSLGTIMPVLVPDLPVYLWTPGELNSKDELLGQLAHIADHWIIDSRRFGSWTKGLSDALSLGPRQEQRLVLHDLAWASLAHWREIVAQHFDSLPARQYLPTITQVEIAFKPDSEASLPIEPVLMAAWMVRQLSWHHPVVSRKDDGTWTILAITDGHKVTISLKPIAGARGSIESIVIQSGAEGKRCVFCAERASSGDEVTVSADAPGVTSVRRTVQMEAQSRSRELGAILETPGRDLLYERTLGAVEELMGSLEAGR